MPPKNFRQLLPAPAQSGPTNHTHANPQGGRKIPSKTRVVTEKVAAACSACRERKVKCDAKRPTCGTCLKRNVECQYRPLANNAESSAKPAKRKIEQVEDVVHQRLAPSEELLHLLRTVPEKDAQSLLKSIRSNADVESVLKSFKDTDLLRQMALSPQVQRKYEFPYQKNMPASILIPENPYMSSTSYKSAFISDQTFTQSEAHTLEDYCPYIFPYHTAQLIEPALDKVDISIWTSIITDQKLFIRLIHAYLMFYHPNYFTFQKDYFIEDLVERRTKYCSRLLVHAVLAAASHCLLEIPDRPRIWKTTSLSYKFTAEAKRLWELEVDNPSLTTIQAGLLLGFVPCHSAMDKLGDLYHVQTLEMIKRLDLLSSANHITDPKERDARAFTAWAAFGYQTMQSYYFFRAPHLHQPPEIPYPSSERITTDQQAGELLLLYRHSRTPTPANFPAFVKAQNAFRVIMNEIALKSFSDPDAPGKLSMRQIINFKMQLNTWFAALPKCMDIENIVLPCQFNLHIEYYGVLISLFRPQIGKDDERQDVLAVAMNISPEQIIANAQVCIETLLRLLYTRHDFENYNPYLTNFLAMFGGLALERLIACKNDEKEALRSTLVLCARGLSDQSTHYIAAKLVLRALLGRMKEPEMTLVKRFIKEGETKKDLKAIGEHVRSAWPMPFIKLDEDPNSVQLEEVAKEYEKLRI